MLRAARIAALLATLVGATGTTILAQVTPEPIRALKEGAPRIALRERFRIGSLDGAHDAFGRIMDVALDRRGRIYVADDRAHRVAVFGADGKFVRAVARRGRGPGELESPWKLAVDAHDSLFVWDMAQARITVFGPDLAYRRDFRVPPQWVVGSIGFLPDGRLLIAAYGRGEPGPLHVLTRDGRRVRTFGPGLGGRDLAGFESSLLGGTAAVGREGIVYSNKSPYEILFFDARGTLRRHCRGDAGWTTRPEAVVRRGEDADALDFGKYVHSANVLPLGGGLYLNVIHDPVADHQLLDVVTPQCRLARRTVLDVPLAIADLSGSRMVAVQTLEFPEVVVYEIGVTR